ncbi:hypothetical protein [Campylobacter sp. RM16187]|uniref:hypothetical protein n=1 Tax=Campylobacter sp. RM16187 TaxID=1660063 RepID=UPI0021B6D17E|nr:hypothetical protein [Campylobacter sp. RM16187]QKG29723.1 hypothetical protein CDOMF_1485 [Campylobacter sp. RM16187]
MNYQYEKITTGKYRIWGRDYNAIHLCTLTEAKAIVASLEAEWLKELKKLRISELNANINAVYKAYLSKYPEVEIRSFDEKAHEAFKVSKDGETPLEDTPILSALTQNNKEARNLLASQVLEKVQDNMRL